MDRSIYIRVWAMQAIYLAFMTVWVAVPYAFWKAFGAYSMLAWLIPTTASVYWLTWLRRQGGG